MKGVFLFLFYMKCCYKGFFISKWLLCPGTEYNEVLATELPTAAPVQILNHRFKVKGSSPVKSKLLCKDLWFKKAGQLPRRMIYFSKRKFLCSTRYTSWSTLHNIPLKEGQVQFSWHWVILNLCPGKKVSRKKPGNKKFGKKYEIS